MSFEQKINQQLNKCPAVKKVVKRVYQLGMYSISKKIKSEGDITRISPDDKEHEYFFGYYDKSPWDATDRYMLCLRANNTWSDVSPREKADIILIDTKKDESDFGRVRKIAETSAWNVQQSCMLQWLGPDYSSRILYNDYRDGKYVSVILTFATMEEKVISAPVYSVSADGKFGLTLDFSRLYELRPGYGYYNVPEKTKGIALPDSTAIWKVDLENGEVSDVLKYTDFADFQPRKEMKEEGSVHKVNHIMLSPNGKRFMVLYRWFCGQRKYTRLITCNVDGTDMYVLSDADMVSHCFWKDDEHILAFENKKDGGPGYYLMKDKTQEYIHCWSQLSNDGHPSYSPDRSLIVTDSYPDRARIAEVKLMDGDETKNEVNVVARVFAPFKYDNDTRCDLHPRWNHAGDKICFDSVFEGHRGLYVVGVPSEMIPKKVKVLYILDTLKQRFGVTAVVMNYFRNIERNKVQIDFLAYDDSEIELVNEITANGNKVYFMPKLSMKNITEFTSFYKLFFQEHREYKIVHSHFNQIDSIVFPIAKKMGVEHCISHSHNTKYSDYKVRAIRNWVMCLPIKKVADVWAACGEEAGEFLFGKEFRSSKKSIVINNAINAEKFRYNESIRESVRKELNIDDEILIGNIGSMKPQKNQTFLIDIFKNLVDSDHENKYKLVIVGDGELKKELWEKVKKLNLEKSVIFTGIRKDIYRILQAMDVFVFPSLYEGLPVVGVEAQASGVTCLFSDTITREVDINNVKFLSINEGTQIWVDAIRNANYCHVDSKKYIENANFDITVEAKKLSQFYLSLNDKKK